MHEDQPPLEYLFGLAKHKGLNESLGVEILPPQREPIPLLTKSRMAIYDERNNHRYRLQPLPLRRTPTRRHRSSRIVTSVVTGGGRGTKSSWGFSFCFPLSFSAWIFLALAFLTFST
uniref:Uncharacterized protein n=1 Tax=Glycine max TaxID=3847 RepID=K7KJC9_SOYBN